MPKTLSCRVIGKLWLSPEVVELRLKPTRPIRFQAGQFLSVILPDETKRLYSFASPPEEMKNQGFAICVKRVPGGKASGYLAEREIGDEVRVAAPFGDFTYEARSAGHNVCFISTGTGIGPIRSILLSQEFQRNAPDAALCLAGARDIRDKLYIKELSRIVPTLSALSGAPANGPGEFAGRVTDYLRLLPNNWPWAETDFYLCGNGQMIAEACQILLSRGVPAEAIRKEAFCLSPARNAQIAEAAPLAEPLAYFTTIVPVIGG